MKRFLKVILYVFLGLVLLGILGNLFDSKTPATTSATPTTSSQPVDAVQKVLDSVNRSKGPESKWSYDDQTDAMTDKTIHYAILEGDNSLALAFPYNTVKHRLQISKKAGGRTVVVIQTFKGQFNTSIDGTTIQVRFDDGKPISFSCSEAADGDASLLFIDDASTFIAKLKKSKDVIIRAMFYDNGYQDMYYSPAGLDWK